MGLNGPISGNASDDVSDRRPILQPYSSYGGVMSHGRDVGGDDRALTSVTPVTPVTTQASAKSPSRTRTSAGTQSESGDEVIIIIIIIIIIK